MFDSEIMLMVGARYARRSLRVDVHQQPPQDLDVLVCRAGDIVCHPIVGPTKQGGVHRVDCHINPGVTVGFDQVQNRSDSLFLIVKETGFDDLAPGDGTDCANLKAVAGVMIESESTSNVVADLLDFISGLSHI